jgi:DNA-binding GntR family transcriptional regulator
MSQAASKPERSQAARKVGRHRIRKAIERMILEGRFRPGEKLVQFQLAKKFGVSQGLIREALFELKEFGLVETSDNRGMFVRSLDARSIYEMLVIREVFDGVAARECCGRISAEDAAKLRKTADAIYEAAVAERQDKKISLDRDFHLEIARLTDNRILMMWAQQHHVLGKVVGNARTIAPEETRRGHYAIIDAILSGDRDLAERAAREHVLAAWPTFEASLTRGPGSVLWLTGDKHAKKR